MAAPYVPLRIFSCYTMLEGAIEPKAIAKQAKRLDFPAAALTDRNGLYAAMPFTDACREAGVQPIIGAMLGVARPGSGGQPRARLAGALRAGRRAATAICARSCPPRISTGRSRKPAHVALDALEGRTRRPDRADRRRRGRARAAARRGAGRRRRADPGHGSRRCFPAGSTSSSAGAATRSKQRAEAALIELAYARDLPLVATNPACLCRRRISTRRTTPCCASPSRARSTATTACARRPRPGSSRRRDMRELFADLPEAIENTRGDRPPLRVRRAQAQADPAEHRRRHRRPRPSSCAATRARGSRRGSPSMTI